MILPGSFAPPRTGTEFPGPRTGAMGQVFVHYDLAVPSNHVYTGHRKQGPHTERETMTSKFDRITTASTGADAAPKGPKGRRRWLPGLPESIIGRALALFAVVVVIVVAGAFVVDAVVGRPDGFRDDQEKRDAYLRTVCRDLSASFAGDGLGVIPTPRAVLDYTTYTDGDLRRLIHAYTIGLKISGDAMAADGPGQEGVGDLVVKQIGQYLNDIGEESPIRVPLFMGSSLSDKGEDAFELTITLDDDQPFGCADTWLWRWTAHYAPDSPDFEAFTYADARRAGAA